MIQLHNEVSYLEDKRQDQRRRQDVERPKVGVDTRRVPDDEDRDVLGQGQAQDEVNQLNGCCVLHEELQVAGGLVEGSKEGEGDLEGQPEDVVEDRDPADGGCQLVDQGDVVVRAASLKPGAFLTLPWEL